MRIYHAHVTHDPQSHSGEAHNEHLLELRPDRGGETPGDKYFPGLRAGAGGTGGAPPRGGLARGESRGDRIVERLGRAARPSAGPASTLLVVRFDVYRHNDGPGFLLDC